MIAVVEARERNQEGEREHRHTEPGCKRRKNEGARKRRRGVPGRKRVRPRRRTELVHKRPVAGHKRLPELRQEISTDVRHEHESEDAPLTANDGQHKGDRDPDEPERPDSRQPDEEPVEPPDAVRDNPALEVLVELDQRYAGTSCLARSINCCGSNGFPMKPRAPRSSASLATVDSTWPLNMITGIDP